MKVLGSIQYVIYEQIFFGGREIAQEECKILPNVSPKYRQNFVNILRVQNFTKKMQCSLVVANYKYLWYGTGTERAYMSKYSLHINISTEYTKLAVDQK